MRITLQRRLIILVGLTMLLMLAVLAAFGTLSVRDRVDEIKQQQLNLAEATAAHVQALLEENLRSLNDVSFTLAAAPVSQPDLRSAIHAFYLRSLFNGGVWLLDEKGRLVLAEPDRPDVPRDMTVYAHVRQAIETGRPVVSSAFVLQPSGEPMVAAVIPRTTGGAVVGLVVGNISVSSPLLRQAIRLIDLGAVGHIELVDANGRTVASTGPGPVPRPSEQTQLFAQLIEARETSTLTVTEEASSSADMLAFFPLTRLNFLVPWGVVVKVSQSAALAPADALQRQFYAVGILLLVLGLFFAWGLARSIVNPLRGLTRAAGRIAGGDLSDPIPVLGSDELAVLARSFDTMRRQLKVSLDRIQQWNRELEQTVRERTRELEESRAARGELLHKLISAQEEERKRIARELHDETSQALVALAVSLDAAAVGAASEQQVRTSLANMKTLAVRLLDGVRQMIFDLRPSVLDDLGLVSALRWYAEERLRPAGIRVRVELSGTERRLAPEVEIALFRVAQEALTNVAKHAEAENVVLSIDFLDSMVAVEIEDDGKGFDPNAFRRSTEKGRGLGLLGMRERVALLDGDLSIDSEPGGGTRVRATVSTGQAGG